MRVAAGACSTTQGRKPKKPSYQMARTIMPKRPSALRCTGKNGGKGSVPSVPKLMLMTKGPSLTVARGTTRTTLRRVNACR